MRKQSTTREFLFTLEAVKSRIDISENQISNVVDEGKINTIKEQSGKWGKKELDVIIKMQHKGSSWRWNCSVS